MPKPLAGAARKGKACVTLWLRAKRAHMSDETLNRYRQSIDNIDAALVFLLAERFKVTQAVGRYKAESGLPPADPGREDRQITRLRELAKTADLDPEFSEKFLRFIIDEVIRHHEQMRDAK
jgi:chorismate mutase